MLIPVDLLQEACVIKILYNSFPRGYSFSASVVASVLVHRPIQGNHVYDIQLVSLTYLEVCEGMPRRHLQRTGA